MMTNEQLAKLGIDSKWLQPLLDTFAKYEINTPQRQSAFIGQCAHESGNFKVLQENLNYSAKGLMATWSSRFPDMDTAERYERQPEKIANKVYARADMGNTDDGDGWKYRGRGVIQLTGKNNYRACGEALGLDLVENPDLILEPKYACLSAGWFWNKRGLNTLADALDIETITKRVNGGLHGLLDRQAKTQIALEILNA
jgi:putative chitinase